MVLLVKHSNDQLVILTLLLIGRQAAISVKINEDAAISLDEATLY